MHMRCTTVNSISRKNMNIVKNLEPVRKILIPCNSSVYKILCAPPVKLRRKINIFILNDFRDRKTLRKIKIVKISIFGITVFTISFMINY